MVLMLKDSKVLDLKTLEIYNQQLLPFYLRAGVTKKRVTTWLACRTVTLTRNQIKQLLNLLNFPQSQDENTLAWISMLVRTINVEDAYWLNDDDCKYQWKDVNPLYTHRGDTLLPVLLNKEFIDVSFETIELTTKGTVDKGWLRDDVFKLFKTTRWKQEVDASLCLDSLNVEHVQYKSYSYLGTDGCLCCNMSTSELSRVTAAEVRNSFYDYNDFLHYVISIDAQSFYNMCVVDYLIANQDRHGENWGFYMDNETGKLVKLHPLFDHNWAFGEVAMLHDFSSKIFPGKTLKEVAYAFKDNCNLKMITNLSDAFNMNVNKSYFLRHCQELNLV